VVSLKKANLQLRYSPKRKAWLIKFCWLLNILLQVLMPTMTADINSWSPETWWHARSLSLCRFATCVNRQINLVGKLASNLCAWLHWTIVILISGQSCGPCMEYTWGVLIMTDKQIYISYAFLFGKYLGWILAFKPKRISIVLNLSYLFKAGVYHSSKLFNIDVDVDDFF